MQITLRRAGRIRSQIESYLKENRSLDTTISMSIYSTNAADTIAAKLNTFKQKYAEISSVINALYNLRQLIDQANQSSGVSELLTNLAECTRQFSLANGIVKSATPSNITEIDAMLVGYRSNESLAYAQVLPVSFIDQDTIDQLTITTKDFKSTINALIAQIDDLNGSTTVDLVDADVSILQTVGLL